MKIGTLPALNSPSRFQTSSTNLSKSIFVAQNGVFEMTTVSDSLSQSALKTSPRRSFVKCSWSSRWSRGSVLTTRTPTPLSREDCAIFSSDLTTLTWLRKVPAQFRFCNGSISFPQPRTFYRARRMCKRGALSSGNEAIAGQNLGRALSHVYRGCISRGMRCLLFIDFKKGQILIIWKNLKWPLLKPFHFDSIVLSNMYLVFKCLRCFTPWWRMISCWDTFAGRFRKTTSSAASVQFLYFFQFGLFFVASGDFSPPLE